MEEFSYSKSMRDVAGHVVVARHYYGTLVRELFMVAGVLILVGVPFFNEHLNLPVLFAVLGVVIIASLAGLTSRKQRFIVGLDAGAALIGLTIFETAAINVFRIFGNSPFFWFNQVLAVLFFFIFYFAVKTFRAMAIEHTVPEEEVVEK